MILAPGDFIQMPFKSAIKQKRIHDGLNQIKGMMKDSYGKQYERRNQTEVPSPRGRAMHTERVVVGRLHGQRLDIVG